jgi:Ca2+-binding EF-hand superfamily protein
MQKLQEQLGFCYELKEYLFSAKIMPKFEISPDISEAIKDRFNTNEPAAVLSQNDLREYLKEYVNNTFYCGMFSGVVTPEMFIKSQITTTESSEVENLNAGRFNSGAFLARLIIDETNFNTISSIFGYQFRYTNIQFDLETDIVIGFFVDHAVEKTVIEVPLDIRQKVRRPQFTHDELEQMRNDFNRLDILGVGFVRPDTIVTFMNSSMRFVNNNPVYYQAFKILNTIENNELGVNVNQFMDSVADVISKFTNQNWETIFSLLTTDNTKRKFDKEMFVETLQKLGYKIHKSEAEDMFDRFALEKPNITREEFVKMMIMSEKGIFKYKEGEENEII